MSWAILLNCIARRRVDLECKKRVRGINAQSFANVALAADAARQGFALLMVAEAMLSDHRLALQKALSLQPEWSNIPMVVITSGGTRKF